MNTNKTVATQAKPPAGPGAGSSRRTAKQEHVPSYARTIRETVESVIIAFVLAFLFRTFEAEAFVIPTGSMAPTLQGAHREIACPNCGYVYRAGASGEADDELPVNPNQDLRQQERSRRDKEVVKATCPMCRYTTSVDAETKEGAQYPLYNGDRILVGKFPYEFFPPQRWDVVVFKFPGDAKMNYIKRLVGLPGETVRIYHGDIFTKRGDGDFEIQRKSPAKLLAMAQPVYDNDYVSDAMTDKGWPVRWQALPAASGQSSGGWSSVDGSRSYEVDGSAPEEVWIRYQHFVPTSEDWRALRTSRLAAADHPLPQLITDYYAYNTSVQRGTRYPATQGLHWVGDLMLESQLDVKGDQGLILLDLVKGGKHFRCTLDVATGQATLSIDGVADYHPTAQTAVRGPGKHQVRFSNFDRQLMLWVDNSAVTFDGPTSYPLLDDENPRSDAEDPGDLAPVGIGSRGASVGVNHMRIFRDIYYIADQEDGGTYVGGIWDYKANSPIPRMSAEELANFMSHPREWVSQGPGRPSPFDQRQEVQFPLKADQFFVLGDNSPCSKDSRLWYPDHFVDRKLLIGKALYIYWPASHNRIPGTKIPFPFFPNFPAMGLVR